MPQAASPLETIRLTKQRARRLAEQVGARKLKPVLERAQRELNTRLVEAEGLRGPGANSFTVTQLKLTMRQIEHVLRDVTRGMKGVLLDQGNEAADRATGDLVRYMQRAERKYRGIGQVLPLDEAMMLTRARSGVEASILSRIATNLDDPRRFGILQRYGLNVIDDFQDRLMQGVLQGAPWADVRDGLVQASPFLQAAPGYWAERIVRTETMGAQNRAGWEATRSADKVLGDMVKILVATFDDRTAADSYAVHGQIRRPNEAFETWQGLVQHPPARPNDREIVLSHRMSWPLPAELSWRSDGEVAARWAAEGHKQAMPPRPKMTTVPLDVFGRDLAPTAVVEEPTLAEAQAAVPDAERAEAERAAIRATWKGPIEPMRAEAAVPESSEAITARLRAEFTAMETETEAMQAAVLPPPDASEAVVGSDATWSDYKKQRGEILSAGLSEEVASMQRALDDANRESEERRLLEEREAVRRKTETIVKRMRDVVPPVEVLAAGDLAAVERRLAESRSRLAGELTSGVRMDDAAIAPLRAEIRGLISAREELIRSAKPAAEPAAERVRAPRDMSPEAVERRAQVNARARKRRAEKKALQLIEAEAGHPHIKLMAPEKVALPPAERSPKPEWWNFYKPTPGDLSWTERARSIFPEGSVRASDEDLHLIFRDKIPTPEALRRMFEPSLFLSEADRALGIRTRAVTKFRTVNAYGNQLLVEFDFYAPDGRRITDGTGTRTFTRESTTGNLSVEHNFLRLEKEFQGCGLTDALFYKSVPGYEQMGINRAHVGTAWSGTRVWAKYGFDYAPDSAYAGQKMNEFRDWLRGKDVDPGDLEALVSTAKSIYRLSNVTYKGRKIGEQFLDPSLGGRAQGWHGEFRLDNPNDPGYKVLKARMRRIAAEKERLKREGEAQMRLKGVD